MIASAPGAHGNKREIFWSLTLLSLTLVTLAASATVARAEPPAPGKLVDRGNLDIYAPYVPASLKFAIAHGLTAKVAATSRIDWPVGFQQATEKYSGQASLDEHDTIQNHISGMPFPLTPRDCPPSHMGRG